MTSYQNAVCDTCKMRKVKCDRDNPCGNCVDGNIKCIRTPPAVRKPRASSKRPRAAEAATPSARKASRQHGFHLSPSASPHSPSRPQSPSILEAQDFIKQEINSRKHMPAYRLAVLKSAMSFVNGLSQVSTTSEPPGACGTRVIDVLEGITYPSIELLYWMLRELTGNSIGPHVLDYFKHVSPKSLKGMGLALINRTGSAETLLLYSICVNSAAYKFVNTMLSEDSLGEVGEGVQVCALTYLSSIKLAMVRIHLLSAPSLLFLQSLLCSAFIAQGSGDLTNCWSFISAACKTCEDLGLENKVKTTQTQTEDDEEVYYCYVWCHILDKNYSMMLGRSRCLLEFDGLELAFASPFNNQMSSLLSTYLHFVPIQAMYTSELHPGRILNNKHLLSKVEYVVQDLLERLERVHARIVELHGPSDSWGGLHIGSELNTIQFSYHSLRTSILRSRQICLPAKRYIDNDCLESARMAMTTLIAIQEASMTISDIRWHVAYMHWTVLYHPIMPFFVLFCNVVTTSCRQDFKTLQLVTTQLDGLAHVSPSIAKLQMLFKSFIELCEGLVSKESPAADMNEPSTIIHTSSSSQRHHQHPHQPLEYVFPVEPPILLPDDESGTPGDTSAQSSEQQLLPPSQFLQDSSATSNPITSIPETADPGWELFDIQPTLDWLDADYSLFDSSQWA